MTTFSYAAYGDSTPSGQGVLGYNGELREAGTGWYLLGRGYRAFNPVLMRFHSPDSLSPFDGGGLNPYAYCNGNPVTFRDPTGHAAEGWSGGRLRRPDEDNPHAFAGGNSASGSSSDAWLSIGLAAAFLVLGVISFGAALPAAITAGLAVTTATVTAVSLGAAVVAEATGLILSTIGYATEDAGLMNAGQIATYAGIALGAPAALIQGYQAVRGIARWLKGAKPPVSPRGSMTSSNFDSGVNNTSPELFSSNFTSQAPHWQPEGPFSSPHTQPPVPNPKPHSWGGFVNRVTRSMPASISSMAPP
ncbi:hypothetical protein IAE39_004190 [Pseudomonas sp. S37]|uniref:RHS repeat-associated core domain-containing protein n=1 Tax=Pseudomonas sp. S37 TaxID=2767449 RepID=UPI001F17E8AE|nr:RHS repeat-associated core domain-containing protein [Pseudomonas sp. S37]MBK4996016.1 hypothetical protein [Pseudomonas sp. S37]